MLFDLVFEGGGAKGMAFVGAIQVLEEHKHTYGRLMGTSAGSITATFIAAGYSASEMLEALNEKDANGVPVFKQFMAKPRPFSRVEIDASATRRLLQAIDFRFVPNVVEERFDNLILNMMTRDQFSNLFSFVERGGWYSADTFLDWARRKLDDGLFKGRSRRMADLTLAEFHEVTGKELTLIAADTTDQRLLVLNHHTAPDVPVVWAMRMSMSVPLLWQEVVWQHEWGFYMHRELTGHCVVDGGLLSNFPIELFLSNDPYIHQQMGPKTHAELLGFLIDESLSVPDIVPDPVDDGSADITILPVTSRIKSLVDTTTQARDKMVIEAFEQYVCRLPAKGYGTTEFNMTDKRREALIRAGHRATELHFQTAQLEGMLMPDVQEMERALSQADQLARNLLTR